MSFAEHFYMGLVLVCFAAFAFTLALESWRDKKHRAMR